MLAILMSLSFHTVVFGQPVEPDYVYDGVDSEEIDFGEREEKGADRREAEKEFDDFGSLLQFGFGPAFYFISYTEEVLRDSKDFSKRGDSTISTAGSKYATEMGLEVHYSFSFFERKYLKTRFDGNGEIQREVRSLGHTISPFLGLYDFNNGINGVVFGILYGFWRGNDTYNDRIYFNFGIGGTIHKDRLVLADGVEEGTKMVTDMTEQDYLERRDVVGAAVMVSIAYSF